MADETENIETGIVEGDAVPDASDFETGTVEPEMPSGEDDELQKTSEQLESEVSGFKSAYEDEKSKRQFAETQLAMLQNAAFQQQPQQEEFKLADDDTPTLKEVRDVIRQEISSRIDPQLNIGQNMIVKQSDNLARQRYDDYDDVLTLTKEMAQANPKGVQDYLLSQPDPAEAAYRLGLGHPKYEEIRAKKANQQVTNKIKKNQQKVNTLSDTGASSTAAQNRQKEYEQMTTAEINAEISRIMNE